MHWDMQLFKVLEHQYQLGLEHLHHDLPQIKCDLEFKGRRLQLRPALEELRTEFYREIKKFISIPTGFKGLGYFEEGAAGKHKVLWSSRSPGTLTMTRALALALTRILPLALALTQP